MATSSPPTANTDSPVGADLLAGISRQAWLTNRAANALQRPVFIGAISVGTFVIALVSLLVAPRMAASPAQPVVSAPRPDTLGVLTDIGLALSRASSADSLLALAREKLLALPVPVPDSIMSIDPVLRDSLSTRVSVLNELLDHAVQAPLPSSYRSLADADEVRSDPRIAPLLDSLADIERDRAGYGAVGGVDPIFVALTSRANEIGRRITAIAREKSDRLSARLNDLTAPAPAAPAAPVVDTLPMVASRDSARLAADSASAVLTRYREISRTLDARERIEMERANAIAPPLAVLASAFVLSGVVGFAFAFMGELRRPRVADEIETERLLRTRVLAVIEPYAPSAERSRRQFDRSAPPYLEPSGEGYQLAYLTLSTAHPAQLGVTVTGEDAGVATIIACNLAAVAADEARNAIVFDLTSGATASAALQARVGPGVAEVVAGQATWPDATVTVPVGRGKTIDLVPRGMSPLTAGDAVPMLVRDASRFDRYYDAVFILMDAEDACTAGLALTDSDFVYCARPAVTPLSEVSTRLEALRAGKAFVRGVVLWKAPSPLIAARRPSRTSGANRAPSAAVAASRG